MRATPDVCVDACFALTLILKEPGSDIVEELWDGWVGEGTSIWAPPLFVWECANGVRRAVVGGRVTEDEALRLLVDLQRLGVRIVPIEERPLETWTDFIAPFELPTAYDATYLTVADMLGCQFWTADRRLYRLVGEALPWVRSVAFGG